MEELKIRKDKVYDKKHTINGQEIMYRDSLPYNEMLNFGAELYLRTHVENEKTGCIDTVVDLEPMRMYVKLKWLTNIDVDWYASESKLYDLYDAMKYKMISLVDINGVMADADKISDRILASRISEFDARVRLYARINELLESFPTETELKKAAKRDERVNEALIDMIKKANAYDKQNGTNVVPLNRMDFSKKNPDKK